MLNSESNNRDQRCFKRALRHSDRSWFNRELSQRDGSLLTFALEHRERSLLNSESNNRDRRCFKRAAEAFGPFLVQSRIESTGRISVHFRFGASGTKIAQRHTGARGPIFARAGVALTHRTRTCLRYSRRQAAESLFGACGWQVPYNLSTRSPDSGAWENRRSARRAASTGLWALLCEAQSDFARAW